ncbi:hypothetical protein ACFSCX_00240 [Bacillus salitolerans]|uniref:Uncharacterized protein n=1 Tax=Bacillus salitolerans TaxID=1437434 RepID=A0ABW4LKP2_9BACI
MPIEWMEKDFKLFNGDYQALANHYGLSKQAM